MTNLEATASADDTPFSEFYRKCSGITYSRIWFCNDDLGLVIATLLKTFGPYRIADVLREEWMSLIAQEYACHENISQNLVPSSRSHVPESGHHAMPVATDLVPPAAGLAAAMECGKNAIGLVTKPRQEDLSDPITKLANEEADRWYTECQANAARHHILPNGTVACGEVNEGVSTNRYLEVTCAKCLADHVPTNTSELAHKINNRPQEVKDEEISLYLNRKITSAIRAHPGPFKNSDKTKSQENKPETWRDRPSLL